MNKLAKREFVKNLCDSIKNDLVEKINHDKIPENWDGNELRELIAEKFSVSHPLSLRDKKRYKEYLNDVIVNNL